MLIIKEHSLFDKFLKKEKEVNELKEELKYTQLSINEFQSKMLSLERLSKQLKDLKADLDRINKL